MIFLPISTHARSDVIKVTLNKCIDGDTASFMYEDEIYKVRFLGINTPELKSKDPFAIEASNYTCSALENAKEIKLEFDPKSDEKDKYERYLAWVFVDNILLETELIKKGYAEVKYIYGDYKYKDLLYQEEDIAKEKKLGIWSDYEKENKDYKEYIYIGVTLLCIILGISTTKIKKIKKILTK